jgi:hypothetical protein
VNDNGTLSGNSAISVPEDEYFTLVFKGNLRKFPGNPLRTETPFGIPFVCAIGDLSEKVDALEEQLEGLTRDHIEEPRP